MQTVDDGFQQITECRACTVCPNGHEVLEECHGTHDTVCSICPHGQYFNINEELSLDCQPCTVCPEHEITRCHGNQDAVCPVCPGGWYWDSSSSSCLLCNKCQKEYVTLIPCGTEDTVCSLCPQNQYLHHNKKTYVSSCRQCSKCPAKNGLQIATPCSNINDTVCKCIQGFFHLETHSSIHTCQSCSRCQNGFEMVAKCNGKRDTVCVKCVQGRYLHILPYTDGASPPYRCESCSACPEHYGTESLCEGTNDTVCTPCHQGEISREVLPDGKRICLPSKANTAKTIAGRNLFLQFVFKCDSS